MATMLKHFVQIFMAFPFGSAAGLECPLSCWRVIRQAKRGILRNMRLVPFSTIFRSREHPSCNLGNAGNPANPSKPERSKCLDPQSLNRFQSLELTDCSRFTQSSDDRQIDFRILRRLYGLEKENRA